MPKLIFENTYSAENLCDVERDICEAFEDDNPLTKTIPMDDNGYFMLGKFTVTITWRRE